MEEYHSLYSSFLTFASRDKGADASPSCFPRIVLRVILDFLPGGSNVSA